MKIHPAIIFLAILAAGCTVKFDSAYNNVWKISGTNLSIAVEKKKPSFWNNKVERRMTMRDNNLDKTTFKLAATDDAYSRVNIYQISDRLFYLQDAFQIYELNAETKSLKLTSAPVDYANRKFVGAFDENESGNWRFIPAAERGEIQVGTQK